MESPITLREFLLAATEETYGCLCRSSISCPPLPLHLQERACAAPAAVGTRARLKKSHAKTQSRQEMKKSMVLLRVQAADVDELLSWLDQVFQPNMRLGIFKSCLDQSRDNIDRVEHSDFVAILCFQIGYISDSIGLVVTNIREHLR